MIGKICEYSQSLFNYAFNRVADENVLVELSAKATARAFANVKTMLITFVNKGLNQSYAIKNAIEDLKKHNAQEIIDSRKLELRAHEVMKHFLIQTSLNSSC